MGWLGQILDPDEWRLNPAANVAKTVACTVAAPVCIAIEVAERDAAAARNRELARQQAEIANREGISGLVSNLGDRATGAIDAVNETGDKLNNIVAWVTIAILAILGIVIIGAIIYFALPFIAFAKA